PRQNYCGFVARIARTTTYPSLSLSIFRSETSELGYAAVRFRLIGGGAHRCCGREYGKRKINNVFDRVRAKQALGFKDLRVFLFGHIQRKRPQALRTGNHNVRYSIGVSPVPWNPNRSRAVLMAPSLLGRRPDQRSHTVEESFWMILPLSVKSVGKHPCRYDSSSIRSAASNY